MYMHAYRLETTIKDSKSLTLENLPFKAGEKVEVIILPREEIPTSANRYPLRGKPIKKYIDPLESVVEKNWEHSNHKLIIQHL